MVTFSAVVVLVLVLVYAEADVLQEREHRGAWIATVYNIDWPNSPTASVAVQQQQMNHLISEIHRAGLNAVYFQVRPAGDSLYLSDIEPWSRYLTGEQGRSPVPMWDPLQYLINLCASYNIEVHAWINPYRANLSPTTDNLAPNHMARMLPEYAYVYSTLLWMDPGAQAVQDWTTRVALDLVKRYDLGGLHMDDYFYPYPVNGLPFPDENTYARYLSNGGTLGRDDWRRNNVNVLIERLNREIHIAKPWVKFSVSPFGIYRPGHPQGMPPPIAGFDQYTEIFCDPKLWLHEGWIDILQPQLYWRIDPPAQSYPILLDWWVSQNLKGRHIMAGNYLSQLFVSNWPLDEFRRQVLISRASENRVRGSWGNVMYSAQVFRDNISGAVDFFRTYVYPEPALQPEFPWLAANTTSISNVASDIQFFNSDRIFVAVDETKKFQIINQIAIYRLKSTNEWGLLKVYPLIGAITDKEVGVQLSPGHYIAAFIDRFGREGLRTQFEIEN